MMEVGPKPSILWHFIMLLCYVIRITILCYMSQLYVTWINYVIRYYFVLLTTNIFLSQKMLTDKMVRVRAQGREPTVENPNPEFMTLLLNIQQCLDDQVVMMQQQVEMI